MTAGRTSGRQPRAEDDHQQGRSYGPCPGEAAFEPEGEPGDCGDDRRQREGLPDHAGGGWHRREEPSCGFSV